LEVESWEIENLSLFILRVAMGTRRLFIALTRGFLVFWGGFVVFQGLVCACYLCFGAALCIVGVISLFCWLLLGYGLLFLSLYLLVSCTF
jgi:hypothetical protein